MTLHCSQIFWFFFTFCCQQFKLHLKIFSKKKKKKDEEGLHLLTKELDKNIKVLYGLTL